VGCEGPVEGSNLTTKSTTQSAGRASGSCVEIVLRCDLCGASEAEMLLVNRDRLHGIPGEFPVIRCLSCGLVRLSPRPDRESLPFYYPSEEYYAYQPPGESERVRRGRLRVARAGLRAAGLSRLGYDVDTPPTWARAAVRAFPNYLTVRAAYGDPGFPHSLPGGSALDVGCGAGGFLNHLRRLGWSVTGVDVSAPALETARSTLGLDVHLGELQDVPLRPASFDFIHMRHVIEHVSSPLATLRRAAELLRSGGLIYIETPNIDSFGFRHCGRLWFPLETPRHLWLFSQSTMRRALAESGLVVRQMRTVYFPSFAWESTYRREEEGGRTLAQRPRTDWRDIPRAAVLSATSRVLLRVRPNSGDILCCWVQRADDVRTP
jgi:2-polyprenyl-3-methyl-5-hydroxy-6-metoxy-1,4-benzoquinol methylase